MDLETEEDPPSFKDAKRKQYERQLEQELRIADSLVGHVRDTEQQMEAALNEKKLQNAKRKGSSKLHV